MADWLGKLPIVQDYVASREHLRERNQTYAFWTTGAFEVDALDKLKSEQAHRTRRSIRYDEPRGAFLSNRRAGRAPSRPCSAPTRSSTAPSTSRKDDDARA